jgi:uncharacterized membrane protein YhaH (DUF805 family)
MTVDIPKLYLPLRGRLSRRDFWIGALGLIIVTVVLAAVLGWLFGALWGNLVTAVMTAYPLYALLAKRFQDQDQPGALSAIAVGFSLLAPVLGVLGWTGTPAAPNIFGLILGFVAAIVAIWILVVCGFIRGTAGTNRYGPDPRGVPEDEEDWQDWENEEDGGDEDADADRVYRR